MQPKVRKPVMKFKDGLNFLIYNCKFGILYSPSEIIIVIIDKEKNE